MTAVKVQNVCFTYPQSSRKALDSVSFEIEEGSYTAIAGANGSGKSTLARLLCDLEKQQEGTIEIAEGRSLGLVFQSPKDQLVSSIVYRDTSFGPQNLHLEKEEIELRTIECLNAVELLEKAQDPVSSLSLGQTQKTALAGMLAIWPDILILDEALSMLDPQSRKSIFEFLRYWHKKGKTIIHITHDLEAINEAQNVLAFDKGTLYFNGTRQAFTGDSQMLMRLTGPDLIKDRMPAQQIKNLETTFIFDNVSFEYNSSGNGVKNVSFALKKGTVTALTGVSGAGKSTLLELASGLLKPVQGTIKTSGTVKLAQQNSQAALFENFVADDVAFGAINNGAKGKELKQLVKTSMDKAGIPYDEFAERHTFELSGGEQRRVAIAGILAMNPDIVLFDEPAAGLDGKSRNKVMQLLKELAAEGKTVLFSTHHEDEAQFAHREIKIENGAVVYDSFMQEETVSDAEPVKEGPVMQIQNLSADNTRMLDNLRGWSVRLCSNKPEKSSGLEKIPAFIRILLFLALFITAISVGNIWVCLGLFLLSICYYCISKAKIRTLLRSFIKILPFLLIFCLLQLIFHPALEGERMFTTWKWFCITPSKLIVCLKTVVRTYSAIASISGFFVSTPEYDFIDGLKILLKPLELIKIPVRYFILIMEIVFRFIPLLIDEASSIIKTQLIRGGLGKAKGKMARIRAVIPLIVPLVIQTIKRSEALADAITMRCFK